MNESVSQARWKEAFLGISGVVYLSSTQGRSSQALRLLALAFGPLPTQEESLI